MVSDHCSFERRAGMDDREIRASLYLVFLHPAGRPSGSVSDAVCFANYVEIDKKKVFIRFGISKEELLIEDITAMHRADRLTLSYCASTDVVLLEPEIRKMWWYR